MPIVEAVSDGESNVVESLEVLSLDGHQEKLDAWRDIVDMWAERPDALPELIESRPHSDRSALSNFAQEVAEHALIMDAIADIAPAPGNISDHADGIVEQAAKAVDAQEEAARLREQKLPAVKDGDLAEARELNEQASYKLHAADENGLDTGAEIIQGTKDGQALETALDKAESAADKATAAVTRAMRAMTAGERATFRRM